MKNMAKMFWALISFVCLVFPCKSVEQYKFRLIDVPDGLSDNQIRGLSMVPDGRVGIRTASILNIYDGASFEYFPSSTLGLFRHNTLSADGSMSTHISGLCHKDCLYIEHLRWRIF